MFRSFTLAAVIIASTVSYTASAQEKSIVCPVQLLVASSNLDVERPEFLLKGNVPTDKNDLYSELEGQITLKDGTLVEVSGSAVKFEEADKFVALELHLKQNSSTTAAYNFLAHEGEILGTGEDEGDDEGFAVGPEGAQILRMLKGNSLQETYFAGVASFEKLPVLKKHGLRSHLLNDVDSEAMYAGQRAVAAGDLKEGEIIGMGIYFNCWIQ